MRRQRLLRAPGRRGLALRSPASRPRRRPPTFRTGASAQLSLTAGTRGRSAPRPVPAARWRLCVAVAPAPVSPKHWGARSSPRSGHRRARLRRALGPRRPGRGPGPHLPAPPARRSPAGYLSPRLGSARVLGVRPPRPATPCPAAPACAAQGRAGPARCSAAARGAAAADSRLGPRGDSYARAADVRPVPRAPRRALIRSR